MIEKIINKSILLATIIRTDFQSEGIEFFTGDNDPLQLGYMNRDEGYIIVPHKHNYVSRSVNLTQEVLFIKSGKVRVDFYDSEKNYLYSSVLIKGDVILLANGGHGFKMLENSEIIEVKQGPYCGEYDKIRFDPVSEENIIFK